MKIGIFENSQDIVEAEIRMGVEPTKGPPSKGERDGRTNRVTSPNDLLSYLLNLMGVKSGVLKSSLWD